MSASWHRHLTLITTGVVFAGLFGTAAGLYDGFLSSGVIAALFADNAALGIAAVGLTLVIFSGGIDLSVGAMAGFTSIFTASLVQQHGFHPLAATALALAIGAGFGATQGALIHFFRQPPFLITLAGLFFLRGIAFWITTDSMPVEHPVFLRLTSFSIPFGNAFALPAPALAALAVLLAGGVVAHLTRFGRNLLALGGSEPSALLMGLPVGATKIAVYTVSGGCAALAGIVGTVYTGAGNPTLGVGLELDAIAVVVIGGTLLTGGRGHMLGTLLGLLIFGTIQSALLFDGRLNSSWVRIVVGALLLTFILLQRALVRGVGRR